jgi:hypothetical protein
MRCASWLPRDTRYVWVGGCVCVREREESACECVCPCACVSVYVCMREGY